MPKWTYADGRWQTGTPQGNGITPGAPPMMNRGSLLTKDLRRYDKPADSEVKAMMKEDDAWTEQVTAIEPVAKEAFGDLRSGKLRVHPDALRANRREIIQEGDREVIVPASMAPRPKPVSTPPVPETRFRIESPHEGPAPQGVALTLKQQIKRGFQAIHNSDGVSHKNRTV